MLSLKYSVLFTSAIFLAAGQTSASSIFPASYSTDISVNVQSSSCNDDSLVAGVVQCSDNGIGSDGISHSGSAFARSEPGHLGVGVGVGSSQPATGSGSQGVASSSAIAVFQDFVGVSVSSGFLALNIELFGSLSASTSGSAILNQYSVALSLHHNVLGGANLFAIDGNRNGDFSTGLIPIFSIITVMIPVIENSVTVNLTMYASSLCVIAGGGLCASNIDLTNSARILASYVVDENGNRIDDWFLGSGSGLDYSVGLLPHVSPVPIPATGLLFLGALGLLSYAGRRSARESMS